MRVYKATALVLRRRNLGETDKLVTLFTREHGKLTAVAKGARRPTSRIAAATEAFTLSRALLAQGQNLDVLTQAEVRECFPGLRSSLHHVAAATYVAELADHLLEERLGQPLLFDLTLSAFYVLAGGHAVEPLVRAYELQMSRRLGFGPSLDACVRCGRPVEGRGLGFSVAQGGMVCVACRVADKEALPVSSGFLPLARTLTATTLPRLPAGILPAALAEIGRLMHRHLEQRTESRLKAALFFESLVHAGAA